MKANPMNPKNPKSPKNTSSVPQAIKMPRGGFNRADLQKVNRPKTNQGSAEFFKEGGSMKSDLKQDKAMIKKAVGMHDKQMHKGKTDLAKLAKGGGIESRGKTKGTQITMKGGK